MKAIAICIALLVLLASANGKPSSSTTNSVIPEIEVETVTEDPLVSMLRSLSEENQLLAQQVQNLTQLTSNLSDEMKELKRENVVHSRTCAELMKFDPTLDEGMYLIDPDGWNEGDSPIYVHCSKSGSTILPHDSEDKTNVGHCYDPGCYSRAVTYNATMRQIKALIELSDSCQQSIRFDCTDAVLAFKDVQYAWWNDREGRPRYYWSGSNSSVHTCACGIAGDCVEKVVSCNCDASIATGLFDEGILMEKDHLPVTNLNFGRTSLHQYVSGEHTLGRFTCSGSTKPVNSSERPTSCSDLWRSGQTVSGFYLVQPTRGSNVVATVFCDMTKLPGETGQETAVGNVDFKNSSTSLVYFDVSRSTPFSSPGSTVTYENTITNIGDAMNAKTGVFKAPVKGVYQFYFDYRPYGKDTSANLYHNEKRIAFVSSSELDSSGMQVLLMLEIGDAVSVRQGDRASHHYDRMSGYHYQEKSSPPQSTTHFIGALVQAI